MAQQVPVGRDSRLDDAVGDDGTREIAPDLAYRRLVMVNVVFHGRPSSGDRGWVLIDAGLVGTRGLIESAASARFGAGARPSAIVLTHGHFDHVGALEALAEAWDVPVYAHLVEHPYLDGRAAYPPGDPEVGGGLLARLARFYPTEPVDVSGRLRALPADGTVPGMPGWRWIHTPGHAPGHVSLWREADRTLIAGDAFVTTAQESAYATALQAPELHGPPRYFTIDWKAARASVEALARLDPDRVVTGHGRAMHGPAMRGALRELSRDFARVAVPDRGRYVDRAARAEDGTAYRDPRPRRSSSGATRVLVVTAAVLGAALAASVMARRLRGRPGRVDEGPRRPALPALTPWRATAPSNRSSAPAGPDGRRARAAAPPPPP